MTNRLIITIKITTKTSDGLQTFVMQCKAQPSKRSNFLGIPYPACALYS